MPPPRHHRSPRRGPPVHLRRVQPDLHPHRQEQRPLRPPQETIRSAALLSPTAHAIDREYRIFQAVGKYNDALSSPGWSASPTSSAPPRPHQDAVPVSRVFRLCTDNNQRCDRHTLLRHGLRKVASSPTAACSPCPPTPPSQPHGTAPFSPSPTCTASIRFRSGSVIMGSARIYILSTVAGKQAEAQDKGSGKRVGPIPEFGKLVKWFSQNLPADKNRIVHGDYNIDNLSIDLPHHRAIRHRVIDVLDWELSTLGHSLSDLAYSLSCSIPLDGIAELRRSLYDPEERVNAVSAGLSLMMGGLKEVEEKVRREGGQPVYPLGEKGALTRT
ncbi:hypothetical protein V8E36_005662 [Tilletia maclaganii]